MTRLTEILDYAKLDAKAQRAFAKACKGPVHGIGRFKLVDEVIRHGWLVVFVDSSWKRGLGEMRERTLVLDDFPDFFCEAFELTSTYAAQEQRNLDVDAIEVIDGRTAYVFHTDYLLVEYQGTKGSKRSVFDPKTVDLRSAITLKQHPDLERAALALYPWCWSRDRVASAKLPKKEKEKLQKIMNRPAALWSIGDGTPSPWSDIVRRLAADVAHAAAGASS